MTEYEVVIAGAGIAGVSTAFHLARAGVAHVLLCDPRPPLTLTSDKSTECYRNWWPGPGTSMVRFMNRSVDLLDEHHHQSGGAFNLSRRGYLFVASNTEQVLKMLDSARAISTLGAGTLRLHSDATSEYAPSAVTGIAGFGEGADVFLTVDAIRSRFPFLPPHVVGGTHVRRAGWLSAQQYGAWMLDEAVSSGVHLRRNAVDEIEVTDGHITAVRVGGDRVRTPSVINAAGPMLNEVAGMVDERLPVVNELHLKTSFRDHLGAVPRDAPMVIVDDPQTLEWSAEERTALTEAGRTDLLSVMPPACHARPEGGIDSEWVIGLWEYGASVMEPRWPLPVDDVYTEVVIRGLTAAFPGLRQYWDRLPHSVVDGGYYTKTPENRPLIGPMRTDGAFVVGAMSGFGVMAAAAAGELAASHVTGSGLPDYADAFRLERYDDPGYFDSMAGAESGQL